MMGESPVFTCKAHVFTIDPRTKKTWLPAGDQAVQVSFFYDPGREQYRIVSLDESAPDPARRMAVNCVLTEKLSFKKTSQKFGQWADTATGAVYGLGFAAEADLDKFVEQFCHALEQTRRLRRQQQPQPGAAAASTEAAGIGEQLQQLQLTQDRRADREGQGGLAVRGTGGAESDARLAQLEKENAALKARVKQLEEAAERAQRHSADTAQLITELQRRLQEAGELATRIGGLQRQPAGMRY